jgi:hypothetical protein
MAKLCFDAFFLFVSLFADPWDIGGNCGLCGGTNGGGEAGDCGGGSGSSAGFDAGVGGFAEGAA